MARQSDGEMSRREFIGHSAKIAAAAALSGSALFRVASAQSKENDVSGKSPEVQSKSVKTLTVGKGPFTGDTGAAIQKAVDELAAAGGGVVEVPAGAYLLHDALHLRAGVHVLGEKDTIFRKVPSVSCAMQGGMGFAQSDFAVEKPELFKIGMGVHITDKNAGGWYDTVGTIIARQGDRFILDRGASHDYNQAGEGKVTSVFPLVDARGVADAGIERVQLDGADETREINGCVGGGLYMFNSQRILAKAVEVRNWRGDAISAQKCVDIFVRGCHVHHATGIGLHPGTGTARYVFDGNHIHDNKSTGLFFCMNTKFSLVRNNRIENNDFLGIQVNERDSDHWIEGNIIRNNGWAGIGFNVWEARSGDRINIQANTIGGNCTKEGSAEVWLRHPVRDIHILDNKIEPAGKNKPVFVAEGCEAVFCDGNTVAGRKMDKSDIAGQAGLVRFDRPAKPLAVRPADMPLDGAMHIGFREPGKFADRT